MPIAYISIAAGRDGEKVRKMAEAVTQAIADSLDAPASTVRVLVTEVPTDRWFSGGTSLADRETGGASGV